MRNCIGRIFELLARAARPGPGRHRTVRTSLPASGGGSPTLRLPRVHQAPVRSLRGEGVGLVGPNVVAHERRREGFPRVEVLCAHHGMVVVR